MTLILCLCSFTLSFSLAIAGHGLESWLFWVVLACYITPCTCALIREQKLYKSYKELTERIEKKK